MDLNSPLLKAALDAFPGSKITRIWKIMEWQSYEIDALYKTSDEAGAHLDRIGKTDLATMTEEEWMTFLEIIVAKFLQSSIPF